MKRPIVLLLALSLIANAGLLATLLIRSQSSSPESIIFGSAGGGAPGRSAEGSISRAPTTSGGAQAADKPAAAGKTGAWSYLQSGDIEKLVANLRAAGFPASVIRAIVSSELNDEYAARRRQILGEQRDVPFWKMGTTMSFYTSAQMSELRALSREQRERLKELLGDDYGTMSEEARLYERRRYGNLPADKMEQLQRINSDYSELRMQVYNESHGMLLPMDRETLAYLEKEKEADLAAILTPQELEEYQLRSSSTATRLHSQLSAFDPTEQEYRSLYALQKEFDDRYGAQQLGMLDEDARRQRSAAQQELQDQIQVALGDQRYTEYKRATDMSFRVASRITEAYQLPAQNAVETWNYQQGVQQRASAIRTDRNLTPEARQQALAAIVSEANAKLTSLLTEPGVTAYKQTGGAWLRAIEMQARPPTPSPARPPGG